MLPPVLLLGPDSSSVMNPVRTWVSLSASFLQRWGVEVGCPCLQQAKASRAGALGSGLAGADLQDRAAVCGSSGRPPEHDWF